MEVGNDDVDDDDDDDDPNIPCTNWQVKRVVCDVVICDHTTSNKIQQLQLKQTPIEISVDDMEMVTSSF